MAIEVLKQKERQKTLMVVFFILIVLTVFVVLSTFMKKGGVVLAPVPAPLPKRVEINFDVLKSQAMKDLQLLEEITMPAEKGRENPFLPYEQPVTPPLTPKKK
jgi:hypothetical protein